MKGAKEGGARRRTPPRLARPVLGLSLAIGLALLAYLQWGGIGGAGPGDEAAWDQARSRVAGPRYQPLAPNDRARLQRQRELAQGLARRHVGTPLRGRGTEDLRVIQDVLDRGDFGPDDGYELQSLGVALGDVMASELDLAWIVVNDEIGRSRALRMGDTEVLIFPITMISKRVEQGVPFTVQALYDQTVRTVEAERAKTGG